MLRKLKILEVWYISQYFNSRYDSRLWKGKFGNGKEMKKSIPIIQERESEAFIVGNGREGNSRSILTSDN